MHSIGFDIAIGISFGVVLVVDFGVGTFSGVSNRVLVMKIRELPVFPPS